MYFLKQLVPNGTWNINNAVLQSVTVFSPATVQHVSADNTGEYEENSES